MNETIAIMTYWQYNDNYGQIFQAYALSHYIESLGNDVTMIKYCHLEDETLRIDLRTRILNQLKYPKSLIKIIWKRITRRNDSSLFICPCEEQFKKFKEREFHWSKEYKTFAQLQEYPPKANIYICGSDMIWAETAYFPYPFFLNFGNPQKRIAYAPSFGRKKISSFHKKIITPLLQKFDNISLREKSGETICKDLGFFKAISVPDPTLLLEREDYIKLEESIHVEGKYAFVYLLGGDIEQKPEEIKDWLANYNLKMVYRSAQGRQDNLPKVYPSPEEWLNYIHNSEIVITNSFHGVVFSIIYRKNFRYLPLKGISASTNERVYDLLNTLGLNSAILKNTLFVSKPIEYTSQILENIKNLKSKGLQYISSSLSDNQ